MFNATQGWQNRIQQIVFALSLLCAFSIPLSTTATDFIFPIIAVLCLFIKTPEGNILKRLIRHPLALLYSLFFALSLAGIFYSPGPSIDIWHTLAKTACFFMGACLMCSLQEGPWPRWRGYIINAFIIGMVITLAFSYLKYYVAHQLFHTRFDTGSVFKDHIIQNYLMAVTAFIFLYRWINKYPYRWTYAILLLLTVYDVLFISEGRSGYFIFAALLFYTLATYLGWRGLLIALALVSSLAILAYSFSSEFKRRSIEMRHDLNRYKGGDAYSSLGIRIQSLKNGFVLMKEKPLLGHGTGSFATVYATLPSTETKDTGIMKTAYNSYLNTAVEMGLLGVGVLLLLFIMQWRYSFYLQKEDRYFMQILFISIAFGCMANAWLSDTTELHFFTFFSGIGFADLSFRLAQAKQRFVESKRLSTINAS